MRLSAVNERFVAINIKNKQNRVDDELYLCKR